MKRKNVKFLWNVQCWLCNANSVIRSNSQQNQGYGRHSQKILATRPSLYSIARTNQPGCTLELMNEGWSGWVVEKRRKEIRKWKRWRRRYNAKNRDCYCAWQHHSVRPSTISGDIWGQIARTEEKILRWWQMSTLWNFITNQGSLCPSRSWLIWH